MKLLFVLTAALLISALFWWWLGKPGLWLRDRMAWVRIVAPGDGAVVQWQGAETQGVRVGGATGWLVGDLGLSVAKGDDPVAGSAPAIPAKAFFGQFDAEVPMVPGWNRIVLQGRWWDHVFATSARIAVGDVFIVVGQSNALGSGNVFFAAASDDVRSARFGADGVLHWRRGDDPQAPEGKGSPWPLVGSKYHKLTQRPVGFINIAENGSSVRDWLPGGGLFGRLEKALNHAAPHYVRGILWAQGEADSAMSAEEYAESLEAIIRASNALTDRPGEVPWIVAQSSYVNGAPVPAVRKGIDRVVRAGLAFSGPDLDVLGPEFRQSDAVHLNAEGTKAAADLWLDVLTRHLPEARNN